MDTNTTITLRRQHVGTLSDGMFSAHGRLTDAAAAARKARR